MAYCGMYTAMWSFWGYAANMTRMVTISYSRCESLRILEIMSCRTSFNMMSSLLLHYHIPQLYFMQPFNSTCSVSKQFYLMSLNDVIVIRGDSPSRITNCNQNAPFGPSGQIDYTAVYMQISVQVCCWVGACV